MSGPGPKPEPKGALEELVVCDCKHTLARHDEAGCWACRCPLDVEQVQAAEIIRLRASLDAVTAERDALELTLRRMTGAAEKALAGLHAPRLEVKLGATEGNAENQTS